MPEDRFADAAKQQQRRSGSSQQANTDQATGDARVAECLNVLGLKELPATFSTIKSAYRRKIGEFHPDKFAGKKPEVLQYAEEMAKKLNVAYAYLEQRFAASMT